MIPYMHQELAAERIAWVHEQARRDQVARIARRARRLRRRGAEPIPAPTRLVRPYVPQPRHAAENGSRPAAEHKDVA